MKKGFTLVELLVVVMILGILTAVAVPQYRRSVHRAEMMEGLTQGKTIYDSALRYKSVNGSARTSFSQLDAGLPGTNMSGASFEDGNFTYTLGTDRLTITSQGSGYSLQMMFPVVSSTGVTQDIYCCATNSDDDGQWLCNNPVEGIKTGCK